MSTGAAADFDPFGIGGGAGNAIMTGVRQETSQTSSFSQMHAGAGQALSAATGGQVGWNSFNTGFGVSPFDIAEFDPLATSQRERERQQQAAFERERVRKLKEESDRAEAARIFQENAKREEAERIQKMRLDAEERAAHEEMFAKVRQDMEAEKMRKARQEEEDAMLARRIAEEEHARSVSGIGVGAVAGGRTGTSLAMVPHQAGAIMPMQSSISGEQHQLLRYDVSSGAQRGGYGTQLQPPGPPLPERLRGLQGQASTVINQQYNQFRGYGAMPTTGSASDQAGYGSSSVHQQHQYQYSSTSSNQYGPAMPGSAFGGERPSMQAIASQEMAMRRHSFTTSRQVSSMSTSTTGTGGTGVGLPPTAPFGMGSASQHSAYGTGSGAGSQLTSQLRDGGLMMMGGGQNQASMVPHVQQSSLDVEAFAQRTVDKGVCGEWSVSVVAHAHDDSWLLAGTAVGTRTHRAIIHPLLSCPADGDEGLTWGDFDLLFRCVKLWPMHNGAGEVGC